MVAVDEQGARRNRGCSGVGVIRGEDPGARAVFKQGGFVSGGIVDDLTGEGVGVGTAALKGENLGAGTGRDEIGRESDRSGSRCVERASRGRAAQVDRAVGGYRGAGVSEDA